MPQSKFINTLPYVSHPVEKFSDYLYVSWEGRIYPKLVWEIDAHEMSFFWDLIIELWAKDILDLWVWWGKQLSGILSYLQENNYELNSAEANEKATSFIMQAQEQFQKKKQNVTIHKTNRLNLPEANPPYTHTFDFAYLIWNSLMYVWGWDSTYSVKAQKYVVNKFADLIKPWWYLLIDTRDYDYIQTLVHLHYEEVIKAYTFKNSSHYRGSWENLVTFPAYISDTLVVLHYYDTQNHQRSKLDSNPIYHVDMLEILEEEFIIEKVYYDFDETPKDKCILRQYLARKK